MPPQNTVLQYDSIMVVWKKIELKKGPIKHMWTVTFDTDATRMFVHRL